MDSKKDQWREDKAQQIRNAVILLFLKYFPDEGTEEAIKIWEKNKDFLPWKFYNESAKIFFLNGGCSVFHRMLYGEFDKPSIEQNVIQIVEILKMLKSSNEITLKSNGTKNKNVKLNSWSIDLLKNIITEGLERRINPHAKSVYESLHMLDQGLYKDWLDWGRKSNNTDIKWDENLDATISMLINWDKEKIFFRKDKEEDYFYNFWYKIIPWKETQNKTDRLIFLYRLGEAFQLYKISPEINLDYYLIRNDILKEISNKIRSQQKGENDMSKKH